MFTCISWTHNNHSLVVIAVHNLADGACVATITVTPETNCGSINGQNLKPDWCNDYETFQTS